MELLTIPVYAKKMGFSRQYAHRMARLGKIESLKGVKKIELINIGSGRKTYILTFKPD